MQLKAMAFTIDSLLGNIKPVQETPERSHEQDRSPSRLHQELKAQYNEHDDEDGRFSHLSLNPSQPFANLWLHALYHRLKYTH